MRKLVLFFLFLGFLFGCQDVIEVEVPTDSPRLVIDAVVRIDDLEQSNTILTVKASETSSFFGEITPAQLNTILIENSASNFSMVLVEEVAGSGIYLAEVPTTELTAGPLRLSIDYNGQSYQAETSFVPSVPIDELRQGTTTLFGDETEIILSFTDIPDSVDFYLFDFDFDQYLVSEDTFYPGQSFQFSYFYDEDLEPQNIVNVSILGIDEQFYNYMNQVIVQSGGDQGPFQTPSATVKGNIVNNTDPENFALGYFAVCQTFTESLEIAEN
ncbi:DUF4249 family protein [Maribacter halichondriae]|uniref:DUF4249 family protein n=1 Tax=Maribacter halichondriae TaxID=2980554 RepID=UPI002358B4AF|nr:DUF4249 family protein [Maribacter sp. Hal144]